MSFDPVTTNQGRIVLLNVTNKTHLLFLHVAAFLFSVDMFYENFTFLFNSFHVNIKY